MDSIESSLLGTLSQNEKIPTWWQGKPVEVQLISIELPITFMDFDPAEDATFIQEADAALTHFLSLNSFYKFEIAKHVFANFQEFCNYVPQSDLPPDLQKVQALNILSFVDPTALYLSRRTKNDKDIYIIMTCECAWDQDHGLQLVFRQGKKLTRVSDQDGHLTEADAFNKPDAEDQLLSAF